MWLTTSARVRTVRSVRVRVRVLPAEKWPNRWPIRTDGPEDTEVRTTYLRIYYAPPNRNKAIHSAADRHACPRAQDDDDDPVCVECGGSAFAEDVLGRLTCDTFGLLNETQLSPSPLREGRPCPGTSSCLHTLRRIPIKTPSSGGRSGCTHQFRWR